MKVDSKQSVGKTRCDNVSLIDFHGVIVYLRKFAQTLGSQIPLNTDIKIRT